MKTQTSFHASVANRAVAFLLMSAMLGGAFCARISAQSVESQAGQKTAKLSEEQRIMHVLNRLGYGARPGDVERVKAMGIDRYILWQLHPERIDDSAAEARLRDFESLRMSVAELYEKYPQPGQLLRQLQRRGDLPADLAAARDNRIKLDNEAYRKAIRDYYLQNNLRPPQFVTGELQASRILRAVYSERQLLEVMVDFWTNHFNVFAGKGADRWLLTSYDRDTIRPHTLGKFSDLLLATAESPAMLFYLDNFQSVSPNAQVAQRPNQQRPRVARDPLIELMRGRARNPLLMSINPQQQRPQQQKQRRGINENYARELMELHTLGVDGGYTQKDVQEVARCFTGWTILAPQGGAVAAQAIAGMDARRTEMLRENAGKFIFNLRLHDEGEKVVLGHKIPAGGGIKDGLMVLDILARHPSTARFIATKLVRHFVSDNPPPPLVDRVAQVFLKSDGDIREMLKAIFFSPEFNSPEAYRAKVKRPFEVAVSAMRALGADTNGGPQIHQWIARMGEPLYGFQTPNGYSDTAENWVNTGALLARMNFGLALASNRIPGTRVNLSEFVGNFAERNELGREEVLDRFVKLIAGDDISAKTRGTLLKQLGDQDNPVVKVVGLILGSPEFQRQ